MFLRDLIERTVAQTPAICPRRASRFEHTVDLPELALDPGPPAPNSPAALAPPLSGLAPRRLTEPAATAAKADLPDAPAPAISVVARPTRVESAEPAPTTPTSVAVELPVATPLSATQPLPTPPPAAFAQPASVAQAPPVHETTIRETHHRRETRVETRTIERRLESVEHQLVVMRTEPAQALASPARPEAPPVSRSAARSAAPVTSSNARPVRLAPSSFPAPVALAPAPVVHVTIGRVEVRATGNAGARATTPLRESKPGLEAYLRRRDGG